MKYAILSFGIAIAAAVALYPALISALAQAGAGQRVQSYNPASHRIKAGTPTMGGALFCGLALILWSIGDRSQPGFVIVFALIAGATIGAFDDLANVRGTRGLGLLVRQKLVLQVAVGLLVGFGLWLVGATRQFIPFAGAPDLHGAGVIILTAIAVVAASNAVNITDGVDGLAGTCAALVFAGLLAVALHQEAHQAIVISAALVGGLLAFLLFNWFPARIFMGDTGSLALGCAIVATAGELHLLWLLPLLGFVFLAETLSVIINVTAIKRFGRRIFRASPIHHHFEILGLREQALVLSFGAACAAGVALTVLYALRQGHIS